MFHVYIAALQRQHVGANAPTERVADGDDHAQVGAERTRKRPMLRVVNARLGR